MLQPLALLKSKLVNILCWPIPFGENIKFLGGGFWGVEDSGAPLPLYELLNGSIQTATQKDYEGLFSPGGIVNVL